MDINEYALELLVRERIADMRERRERSSRIRAARPESQLLRLSLAHALIHLGHHVRRVVWPSRTTTAARDRVEARGTSTPGAVRG
jgi:hypothetical protein